MFFLNLLFGLTQTRAKRDSLLVASHVQWAVSAGMRIHGTESQKEILSCKKFGWEKKCNINKFSHHWKENLSITRGWGIRTLPFSRVLDLYTATVIFQVQALFNSE